MFTTKRCLAILAFIVCGTFVYGQAPAGLPAMPNTGNPEADAITYDQAKQAWLAGQPSQAVAPAPANANAQASVPLDVRNAQHEAQKMAATNASNAERNALLQANALRELQREYTLNKDLWSATDPERLAAAQAALGISETVGVSYIPQSEFLTFDAEKQAYLLANPNLFVIVQD